MEIRGDGHLHFYDESDFVPHSFPADEEWWNESFWLHFVDPKSGVHGTMRLGHQSNWNGGHCAIWNMIGTPDWVYKRDGLYPLQAGDRQSNGIGGNGTHQYRWDGAAHWTINDSDLSVDIRMVDHHRPFSFWPSWKNMAANHLEASGTLEGTVTLKGRRYDLTDVPAYRDQSWGVRHWTDLRSHRWVATTISPELSCNVLAVTNQHGDTTTWGYVRRGNTVHLSNEIDVVTFVEQDGISHRGGTVRYTLPDDEVFEVNYERVNQGALSRQHQVIINDTACFARHGEQIGSSCFEITNNILGGSLVPMQKSLRGSVIGNGIWPAVGPFGEG